MKHHAVFLVTLALHASLDFWSPARRAFPGTNVLLCSAAHQGRDCDVDSRLCLADADCECAASAVGFKNHRPLKR